MTSDVAVVVPSAGKVEGRATRKAVEDLALIWVDDSIEGGRGPTGAEILETGGAGFAKAANVGLERAASRGVPWVLLLNDDAVPAPGCVAALRAAVERDGVVAAGPILEGPEGIESAGLAFHEATARLRQLTVVPETTSPVDALSGACLLVGSSVRFDERFPHGFEDVDLALRLRREGGTLVVVPAARCWHAGGGTVPRRSRQASRDAVRGHLRLAGPSRVRRGLVVAYALAQITRERGPADRVLGVWEAWRAG